MTTPANLPKPDLGALRIGEEQRKTGNAGKRLGVAVVRLLIAAPIAVAALALRNQRPAVEVALAQKAEAADSRRAAACSSCFTCAVEDPRSTSIKGKVQSSREALFRPKRPTRSLMARPFPCALWQLRRETAPAKG